MSPVEQQAADVAGNFMNLIGTFSKLLPQPNCPPRILL